MTRALLSAIVVATLLGCATATGGLDLHFEERHEDWVGVVPRLRSAPVTSQTLAVVGVTTGEDAMLVAYDDDGHARWRITTTSDATVRVTPGLVLTVEGDDIVAHSASDGQPRFRHALERMVLIGAAQDGERLLLVSAQPSITTTQPLSRITAIDARSGRVNWTRLVSAAVGAPIVRGRIALLPWNRQAISAIDLTDGDEIARYRPTSGASIEWLADHDGMLTFGAQSLHALLPTGSDATCDAVTSPFATAPSQPAMWTNSFQATRQAGIHVAYAIDADDAGCPGFASNRAYLVFYRYVFAIDPTGTLAWVKVLPADVIAAHATSAGVSLIDTRGARLTLTANDGVAIDADNVGDGLRSALILRAHTPRGTSEMGTSSPASRREQLLSVILDIDNRLVVARAYAVEQLAGDDDAQITADLLAAYEHPRMVSGLRAIVGRALLRRHAGAEHLVSALDRHHDHLRDTIPPPLDVVAPALSAMGATESVGALLSHLHDPATDGASLTAIAQALLVLGDARVGDQLIAWLRRYRLSTVVASEPQAVDAIARAALKLGGETARVELAAIAARSDSTPVYAATILAVLSPPDEPSAPSSVAAADPTVPSAPRAQLTQLAIDAAFAEHAETIRPCIADELERSPTLAQVRTAFVAEPDGSTRHHVITPDSEALRACLMPLLRDATLPPFSGTSVVATYVVRVHRAATVQPPPATEDAEEIAGEWWRWYARPSPPSETTPWWMPYVQRDVAWFTSVGADTAAPTPPASLPATPTDSAWWLPREP